MMEWTAAITGDCVGLFLDFSSRRKIWGTIFQGGNRCFHYDCCGSKENKANFVLRMTQAGGLFTLLKKIRCLIRLGRQNKHSSLLVRSFSDEAKATQ